MLRNIIIHASVPQSAIVSGAFLAAAIGEEGSKMYFDHYSAFSPTQQ